MSLIRNLVENRKPNKSRSQGIMINLQIRVIVVMIWIWKHKSCSNRFRIKIDIWWSCRNSWIKKERVIWLVKEESWKIGSEICRRISLL